MVVCENNGKEEGDVDIILGGFDVGIDERKRRRRRMSIYI
jgi:hypothetical protein